MFRFPWQKEWETGAGAAARPRLSANARLIYAVGDVHGCLNLLQALEARIVADARNYAGQKLIVMLGDYVDRGPQSAQVLDHLLARPPAGFQRICLAGNHEAYMADFLERPSGFRDWLEFGGIETLQSYGIPESAVIGGKWNGRKIEQLVASHVPGEHLQFLRSLPISLETPDHVFVHAGLRPGVAVAHQEENDLLWFRDHYAADYAEFGKLVVHGHTPVVAPFLSPHRIGIDTGACITGVLSAVRLVPGEAPAVIAVRARGGGRGKHG